MMVLLYPEVFEVYSPEDTLAFGTDLCFFKGRKDWFELWGGGFYGSCEVPHEAPFAIAGALAGGCFLRLMRRARILETSLVAL